MKIISIGFYFFLLSNSTYAQIDYSYFKQTWCKCLSDSGAVETDTLTFRIESEACKTSWYSKTHVYSEKEEFSFRGGNIVHIYTLSGSAPRNIYVGTESMEVFYKINYLGDTIGVDSMHYNIQPEKTFTKRSMKDISYQLNKSKNILTFFHGKNKDEYEILFLSSKMLLMRKIH